MGLRMVFMSIVTQSPIDSSHKTSGENANFQNVTSFPFLAIYSKLPCVTYASFGDGGIGSHIIVAFVYQSLKLIPVT